MKVCVVGAGAIGGMIAAHFARAGFETGVVARGPHLQAIRERGLTLTGPAETFSVKVSTHEDPAAFGVQNIVVIGLKAHQIPAMLPRLGGMVRGAATPFRSRRAGPAAAARHHRSNGELLF